MLSLRWPSPMLSFKYNPSPSGPRCLSTSRIASRTARSTGPRVEAIPLIPHIRYAFVKVFSGSLYQTATDEPQGSPASCSNPLASKNDRQTSKARQLEFGWRLGLNAEIINFASQV